MKGGGAIFSLIVGKLLVITDQREAESQPGTWRDFNTSPTCKRDEPAYGCNLSLNETLRLSSPFILPSLHSSLSSQETENLEENWQQREHNHLKFLSFSALRDQTANIRGKPLILDKSKNVTSPVIVPLNVRVD